MCFDLPEYILECSDDGSRWEARLCGNGQLCHDASCQTLVCVPDSKVCEDGKVVACNSDGSGRLVPVACADGEVCADGACLPKICEPGALQCRNASTAERCEGNGTRWEKSQDCGEGAECFEGACLPKPCSAGQTECGPTTLFTCGPDGAWRAEPCPDSQPCLFSRCVECVGSESCAEGEICEEGACVATLPVIKTEELTAGTVGTAYSFALQVQGGKAPYRWTVMDGSLPAGISLSDAGLLSGIPSAGGTAVFRLNVEDADAKQDDHGFTLEVISAGGPLRILTTTLPNAEHGLEYEATLEAAGGAEPYAWQVLRGALPQGLALGSNGKLEGIPGEIGIFPVTVRVVDGLTPPGWATKDLSLTVEIAPLTIEGAQQLNLLITKIIALPVLVPYIPYSADLVARGGLQPYTWSEQAAPAGLSGFIPNWGMPSGLAVEPAGKVAGWVTDVSDAIVVNIPFGGPTLTGYFFSAKVTDSQNPAAEASAIYCIPTVPLSF
jgi:hypothetical protein